MTAKSDSTLTDALTTAHYNSSCADAAGMGIEIPCEEAYGQVVEHARRMEKDRARLIECLRECCKSMDDATIYNSYLGPFDRASALLRELESE